MDLLNTILDRWCGSVKNKSGPARPRRTYKALVFAPGAMFSR
jgi:hypothetical protein